jgi:hypothetical protein
MNKTDKPQAPGHMTRKDSIACGIVLASMLMTMVCGAFVVDAGPDTASSYAQAAMEGSHE